MTLRIVGPVTSLPSIRSGASSALALPLVLLLVLVLAAPAKSQSWAPLVKAPRWPDRTFNAVRVWIQPNPNITHWTPAHVEAARDAFISWSRVEIGVPFTFVADSAVAEIRVRWTERFGEPISGHTRADHDAAFWIVRASLDLAVHHHSGVVLDNDAMRAIALHEVGHALGLEHLPDSTSVMAPAVRARALTVADRAAALRLYEFRDSTASAPRPHR